MEGRKDSSRLASINLCNPDFPHRVSLHQVWERLRRRLVLPVSGHRLGYRLASNSRVTAGVDERQTSSRLINNQ